MREAIGGSQLLLIIVTIFIATMMLLAGSIGYTKAFKARNAILNIIQSHGAYGKDAPTVMADDNIEDEIATILNEMGYHTKVGSTGACKNYSKLQEQYGAENVTKSENQNYNFCVYSMIDSQDNRLYGVETYMYFELPLFGRTDIFSFPLYADSYTFFKTN